MVASRKLFAALILASTFRLVRTGSNRSIEICTPNTSVDSTNGRINNSGFFPREKTRSTNGKTLEKVRPCLSLCCPDEKSRNEGDCAKDNVTDSNSLPTMRIFMDKDNVDDEEVSAQNFYPLINDPCDFDWMAPSVLINFSLLVNGSIYGDLDGGSLWDYEHYCLFRAPGSRVYLAKVCRPWIRKGNLEIFASILVMLIMLAIFVVYRVVPELRNINGMIFRSYVATYLAAAGCLLAVELTTESKTYVYWYTFSERTGRCCGFSCLLWLNVMSFNIWRSFRDIRSVDFHTREREKQTFIWYAVYAWVCPAVLYTGFFLTLYYVPYFRNETVGHKVKIWASVGPITIVYLGNAFLYISTAMKIKDYKKDTVDLANGTNKHHGIAEQWFNLYIKLFLVMGGHLIVWVVWLLCSSPAVVYILVTVELGQGVLIFVIFVWKENVRKSFCGEFNAAVVARFNKPYF